MMLNTADPLESCARRVEAGIRTCFEGILIAGEALAEARTHFGENDKAFGQWRRERMPWLHANAATRFLQVWERMGARLLHHNGGVDRLAPTVLYALAAPSTPDAVVEHAIDQAEAGERVTVADVQKWKDKAKTFEDLYNEEKQQFGRLKISLDVITQDLKESKKTAKDLTDQLRQAKKAKPAPVVETHTVEVVPDGYASAEQAIAAAETKLRTTERQLADLERKRDAVAAGNDLEYLLKAFVEEFTRLLGDFQDVRLALHAGVPARLQHLPLALAGACDDLAALCRQAASANPPAPSEDIE